MRLFRTLFYLPEPAATWSDAIDGLHAVIVSTAIAGCLGVFAYTAYALIFYRSKAPFRLTPHITHSFGSKVALIGGLLTLFLVWWVLGYRLFVRMVTPPATTLDIQVIAKQWMWTFVYPDGTSSDGVLVVPARTPVRLLLTSRDVIHSFYVPAMRVKRDVVPGMVTSLWFEAALTGTFPAPCTEFCGLDHSRMRAWVVVLPPSTWSEWAARRGPLYANAPGAPVVSLVDQGRLVAVRRGCLRCHTVDGTAHLGPTWVGAYGSDVTLADGSVVKADETYLTRSMMDPAAQVVSGFQPVMPTYRGVLTVEETGALVAYLRALRDGPDQGSQP